MINAELIVVITLLALVTLPLVVMAWRSCRRGVAVVLGVLWLGGVCGMGVAASVHPRPTAAMRSAHLRPLESPDAGYVSSNRCQSCHPHEYATWHDSYHRRMTQVATEETVVAPWNGATVMTRGQRYVMQKRGDEFWVEMDQPDWDPVLGPAPRVWRQVVQTTGSHHWQFYWYATGEQRKLHMLLCSYRIADDARWVPVDGCCISPPDGGQETGIGRWTLSCNKCHSTHGRPRVQNLQMDTHVSELGIACEACHGPGETHVLVNRDPRRRYAMHRGDDPDETIVNPERLDHRRASHVCGNCHGVTRFASAADRSAWSEHGFRFRPGELITDTRQIETSGGDKFWADGMIRVSGREFNGLLKTPCYTHGDMSCMSCHQMHQSADDPRSRLDWADDQLKPGMRGNLACTQCHEEYADSSVLVAHTYHGADSSGSNCMNCHMPHTTYGLLKSIRSHMVDSPDIAVTLHTGRPNACNLCHLDKSLQWTADHLRDWYDQEPHTLTGDDRDIAASIVWGMRGEAGQRALVAAAMGRPEARAVSGTDWMSPILLVMMNDPYHAVRYIADRSVRMNRGMNDFTFDYMAGYEERIAITQTQYGAWLNAPGRNTRLADPALLLLPDGGSDVATINRLLAEQDDRRITLNE